MASILKKAKRFAKNPDKFSLDEFERALKRTREVKDRANPLNAGRLKKTGSAVAILEQLVREAGGNPFPPGGGLGPTQSAGGNNVDSGGFDFRDRLGEVGADPDFMNLFSGKNADVKLMAATFQDAVLGRAGGVAEFDRAQGRFTENPLVQQLEQTALNNLQAGDLVNADQLVAGSDARLSQSFQNQNAGLQNSLGIRGIDPNSGIAQELAAQARFGTLQQGALNESQIRTQSAQVNRAAIEDAMRLGLNTAGFQQGVQNQFTSNIANLMAGQPLAQIGPESAALAVARQAPGPSNNFFASPAGQATTQLVSSLFGAAGGAAAACWVAAEVFDGWEDPRTHAARRFIFTKLPKWVGKLYVKYGERFAAFISTRPALRKAVKLVFSVFADKGA